jgi:NADH-dependent peroxiredoxin subunit F
MYDLIIVGGGPAGLTAMVYAIRKHINALLITEDLGGKTNYHLELPDVSSYRVIRGVEIVNKFKEELEYLDNFTHRIDSVQRVYRDGEYFRVLTGAGDELYARAVIIATGARPQRLHVTGEEQFLGKALAYSALSYALLMLDKRVAVIGDGELALRSAAELAMIASEVVLAGPSGDAMQTLLGKKVQMAEHVTILEAYQLREIRGDTFAREAVLDGPDGQKTVAADCFFIEKALIPNSNMVHGLVELDAQGRVKIDCSTRSSVPGLFAAGDVTSLYAEQVLIAVGEGAKAALSAYDYLLPNL